MTKELQGICILSGPSKEVDLSRASTGISHYMNHGYLNTPFKILGAGPDLNVALDNWRLYLDHKIDREEFDKRLDSLDHHLELYIFVKERIGGELEAVTSSVTLVQNVLHGFQNEQEGKYAIVTEPWHYRKFRRIENSLKKRGRISQDLEFFNVPSPDGGYYSPIRKIASHIKTALELRRA